MLEGCPNSNCDWRRETGPEPEIDKRGAEVCPKCGTWIGWKTAPPAPEKPVTAPQMGARDAELQDDLPLPEVEEIDEPEDHATAEELEAELHGTAEEVEAELEEMNEEIAARDAAVEGEDVDLDSDDDETPAAPV